MDRAQRATMTKEELKLYDNFEFVKRTDEKSLRRKIQDLVNLAKQVRKEELAEKRERLRALFHKEDKEYEDEYMQIVQNKVHDDIQKRLNHLVEIQKERQMESQELVQLNKVQQYMNNSDSLRGKLRENLLHDTKLCQMMQIEEKRREAILEKEQNRMWEEVAKKHSDEQARFDACKELRKQEELLKDRQILRDQIENARQFKEKLRKEEMEDRLRIEAKLKKEQELESLELAGEAGKKLQQAKSLQAQLLEVMELKKRRVANEIAFDRMFEEAISAQYSREQKELAAKVNTFRQATLTYLQYLRELKEQKAVEDYNHTLALREFQLKANEKRDREFHEMKAKKAAEAKKAHEELLRQLSENRMRQIKEMEENCRDAEKQKQIWECEVRKDQEKEKERELFALNYGKELKEQVAEIRKFQEEQEKKFEIELQNASRSDEYCEQLVSRFMSGDVDYLKAHPNWRLMTCSCLNK